MSKSSLNFMKEEKRKKDADMPVTNDTVSRVQANGDNVSHISRKKCISREEKSLLESKLEQEMRYRITVENLREVRELFPDTNPDTVMWSVAVIEQSIKDLEDQKEALLRGDIYEDTEYKLRCEAQKDLNDKLKEQTLWYSTEVDRTTERLKKGSDYSYEADLEGLNEFELAQMVRNLERERNFLYSEVRNKSWLLDKHSKEYHHLKELSTAYAGDLTIMNRSLEKFWRQRSDSGFARAHSPVTSPGGLRWSSGESGILPSQRILDPKKGPIRKTVGVRSLPRLDLESLDNYDYTGLLQKARPKYRNKPRTRAKSLDLRKPVKPRQRPSAVELVIQKGPGDVSPTLNSSSGVFEDSLYEASNEASTLASAERASDKSNENLAVESVDSDK